MHDKDSYSPFTSGYGQNIFHAWNKCKYSFKSCKAHSVLRGYSSYIFPPTLQSSSKLNGELPDPTGLLGSIPGCHISKLMLLTTHASDHSFFKAPNCSTRTHRVKENHDIRPQAKSNYVPILKKCIRINFVLH